MPRAGKSLCSPEVCEARHAPHSHHKVEFLWSHLPGLHWGEEARTSALGPQSPHLKFYWAAGLYITPLPHSVLPPWGIYAF